MHEEHPDEYPQCGDEEDPYGGLGFGSDQELEVPILKPERSNHLNHPARALLHIVGVSSIGTIHGMKRPTRAGAAGTGAPRWRGGALNRAQVRPDARQLTGGSASLCI